MALTIQSTVFTVSQEGQRAPLEPAYFSQEKVKRIFWNVLSVLIPIIGIIRLVDYALGRLAAAAILPASWKPISKDWFTSFWFGENGAIRPNLIAAFSPEFYTVKTRDGAELSAVFFKNKNANERAPTILSFQPNAATYFQDAAPLHSLIDQDPVLPAHFAFFDYRSVGDSKGRFSSTEDLVEDGVSVVEWLVQEKKIPKEKIVFFGRSLGGAVAVMTKEKDPELTGPLISDRSFSSLEAVVNALKMPTPFKAFFQWVLKRHNFVLDPGSKIGALPGEKLLFYAPNDHLIPLKASLVAAASDTSCQKERLIFSRQADLDEHNIPLDFFERNPLEKIRDLLLKAYP